MLVLEAMDDVVRTEDSMPMVIELVSLILLVDGVKETTVDEKVDVDTVDPEPDSELNVLLDVLERSAWLESVVADSLCEELVSVVTLLCIVVTSSAVVVDEGFIGEVGAIEELRVDLRVMVSIEDREAALVYSVKVVGSSEGDEMPLVIAELVDLDEGLDKGLVG